MFATVFHCSKIYLSIFDAQESTDIGQENGTNKQRNGRHVLQCKWTITIYRNLPRKTHSSRKVRDSMDNGETTMVILDRPFSHRVR